MQLQLSALRAQRGTMDVYRRPTMLDARPAENRSIDTASRRGPANGAITRMLDRSSARPSALETFWRGFRRFCPRCGQGHMFAGYLSVRTACEVCGLEFEPLRSDDVPPYFTLFIVGHLVVSLYLAFWRMLDMPAWAQALVWCGLTLVLSLVLLPFIKGGVMAVIFLTKAKA